MAGQDESSVAALLGGPRHVGQSVRDSNDLVAATRKGLRPSSVVQLAAELDLPAERVAAAAGVSKRTWARRRLSLSRRDARLRPDESDRLVRLARVVAMAIAVLGSIDRAREWFSRPNRALGGETPIALVDTDTGTRLVESVLGRIAHGVYS